MTGRKLALWTGLAGARTGRRIPRPPSQCRHRQVWDDHGTVRRDGGDDIAFVDTLITRLRNTGAAGERPVFIVGLANGAAFAERVARTGAVDVAGVALVAGTAREARPARAHSHAAASDCPGRDPRHRRQIVPVRGRPLAFAVPPSGEPPCPPGAGRHQRPSRSSPPKTLLDDWTRVNGVAGESAALRLDPGRGDPPVTRLTWAAAAPPANATAAPVVLYRVEGGGHGWPGARQVPDREEAVWPDPEAVRRHRNGSGVRQARARPRRPGGPLGRGATITSTECDKTGAHPIWMMSCRPGDGWLPDTLAGDQASLLRPRLVRSTAIVEWRWRFHARSGR